MKFSLQLTFSCTPGISQRPSRIAIRLGTPSLSLRARTGRTHGAGRDFFSRRPLQKLAVPKRLHEESSPALRLNSALTGVRQRRKNARENFPHAGTKKQHNFFTGLREKKSLPAPCVLPVRARRLKEGVPSRMAMRKGRSEIPGGRKTEGLWSGKNRLVRL